MPISIPITGVQYQGTSIQGLTRATILYSLQSPLGELLINRRPLHVQIDLDPTQPFLTSQQIADTIASDLKTRFGSPPDTVVVGGSSTTPSKNLQQLPPLKVN